VIRPSCDSRRPIGKDPARYRAGISRFDPSRYIELWSPPATKRMRFTDFTEWEPPATVPATMLGAARCTVRLGDDRGVLVRPHAGFRTQLEAPRCSPVCAGPVHS